MIRYETGLPKEAIEASIAQRRPPTDGVLLIGATFNFEPSAGARDHEPQPRLLGAPALVEQAAAGLRADRPQRHAGPSTRAAPDAASVSSTSAPMPISLDTDLDPPLARDRAGRERARPGQPEPARRRRRRARRQGARRGLPRRLRRGARRARGARRLHRRPARRDALRVARAVLPPRADAAVHRRDPRGRHRAASSSRSDDPTEKASGRGLGILRDEGVEVVVADGEPAVRARLLNQAFRKHARTGRPHVLFKSAMTLDGKVATRTGDSKWISGEESRAALAPLARRARRGRGRDRHRARRRPAARRADRRRRAPAAPRRVRLRGPAAARLPARARRARAAADRRRRPRRLAAADRRARGRGRRRDRRDRRERARARALGARPARRRRRHVDPARGRAEARGRVPRRRRGRRAPAVPRAGRASAARTRATRSRARASSGSPRRRARWRSTSSGSPTTC